MLKFLIVGSLKNCTLIQKLVLDKLAGKHIPVQTFVTQEKDILSNLHIRGESPDKDKRIKDIVEEFSPAEIFYLFDENLAGLRSAHEKIKRFQFTEVPKYTLVRIGEIGKTELLKEMVQNEGWGYCHRYKHIKLIKKEKTAEVI